MSTTTTNLGLFKYDTSTDAQLAFNINQALNGNWDILDKSTLNGDIITLGSSGTQSLTNNRVHKITCNGNTTFSLPTGSGTEFKEIVVLLYMPTAYSISLGTSVYFGGSQPDMSNAGYYTIIYEYDPIQSSWVVGVLSKETSGVTPIEYPWTQPILSANGVMGGDNFACATSPTQSNAYYLFDGNNSSYVQWGSSGVAKAYFYNPKPLKVSQITASFYSTGYMPTTSYIYGSNDNTNWTDLSAIFSISDSNNATWVIPSASQGYYKYYQIYGTGFTNGSNQMCIYEVTVPTGKATYLD